MRDADAQEHATDLRKNMTDAERHLWHRLRGKQLAGYRFRRQVPIGPYIADFACLDRAAVVVELDGGQHLASRHDEERDDFMRSQGYVVLRFWNDAVFKETDAVLEVILKALKETPPSRPSPASGGRRPAIRSSPLPPPLAGEGRGGGESFRREEKP